eukprot:TRINITY_DN23736_c0_g1_i3.p1 TRINITY_DN23736_c0_g1~~TRINITY_DN23736_c0_g1_i3.p1  ORF type:complete len:394 (+),score=43.83 TRINITY_DN23736_c0_g1_i3:111-1184(+)
MAHLTLGPTCMRNRRNFWCCFIQLLALCVTCAATPISIEVFNLYQFPVNLYWESSHGPLKIGAIDAGGVHPLATSDGHGFAATAPLDGNIVVQRFTARLSQPTVRLVPPEPQCALDEVVERFPGHGYCTLPGVARPKRTTLEEFRQLSVEETVMRDREFSRRSRLELNRAQPARVPKFTPSGFELRRVPDDLWQLLHAFWLRKRTNQTVEVWSPGDAYVNHWVAPPYMVLMPETLRRRVLRTLQPLLQDWAGLQLEPTSCYGIRVYKNNSVLEDHVDRVETHVVSAILNIDQLVDEPWPLDIFSHDGRRHSLILKPGDMVFYESAACIHGRSTPMRGSEYANIFVHFRPTVGWDFKS